MVNIHPSAHDAVEHTFCKEALLNWAQVAAMPLISWEWIWSMSIRGMVFIVYG